MIDEYIEILPGIRVVSYGEALIFSDLSDIFWNNKWVQGDVGSRRTFRVNWSRSQLTMNDGSVSTKAWVDINVSF